MFRGTSIKQRRMHQDWHRPGRLQRSAQHANRYPLAEPYDPGGLFQYINHRYVVT